MGEVVNKEASHYYGVDLLRAFSCLAILFMHVGANAQYPLDGYFYDTIVESWKNLVFLFMMISGFGMSCGYHKKILDGKLNVNSFYSKRYLKILPFFGFLLLVAIVIEHKPETIMESFAESTLMFGLLPKSNLDTIGVSWTLGVIFVFYLLYPFIVFLTGTKKRAVFTLIGSAIMNYLCTYYFFTEKFVVSSFSGRSNIMYCLPFFIVGVMIYQYKERIRSFVARYKFVSFIILLLALVSYYLIPYSISGIILFDLKNLIVYALILMFAIGMSSKLCNNKIVAFLSAVSMEVYLSHMVLFRVVEKANLLYIAGNGWISYILSSCITVVLVIAFIEIYKFGYKKLGMIVQAIKGGKQV